MTRPVRQLAVLGSPIAHSRSPALHEAAYRALGLDWQYGRRELTAEELPAFVDALGPEWRGLSLTMPLKEQAARLADEVDELARMTGAVNTLLIDDGIRRGWNTDVGGIVRAFEERAVPAVGEAVLLGAGATARSAMLALARHGVRRLTVAGRNEARVAAAVAFAAEVGLEARPHEKALVFDEWPSGAQLVVSTLPGDAAFAPPRPLPGLALFDVAYSGSRLVAFWREAAPGAAVVEGIDMLVHQALLQVRVFVSGDVDVALPGETGVLRAMDSAVGRS